MNNNNNNNIINNNSCSSNSSCNNNDYNIKLYNSVFNNCFLKKIIFYHLNIFNVLYINIEFKSKEEWDSFMYKEYLNSVTLSFDYDIDLPDNIKHINIFDVKNITNNSLKKFTSISVTTSVSQDYLQLNSLILKSPSVFNTITINEPLNGVSIPESFSRVIINKSGSFRLPKLPNSLKYLEVSRGQVDSYKDSCFPQSLTCVGKLRADPSIINQFPSKGLVKLNFGSCGRDIGRDIRFPETLLELSVTCPTFDAILPSNLKSLELIMRSFNYKLLFPSSLENLKFSFDLNDSNILFFQDKSKVPPNLRVLELSASAFNMKNQPFLPDKLEKLVITGLFPNPENVFNKNKDFEIKYFPPSLTYIDLGYSYNVEIKVNSLPEGLNTLILGHSYSKEINPLAIPKNLKLLEISNPLYPHYIKITGETHPFTLINNFGKFAFHTIEFYKEELCAIRLPNSFNSTLSILELKNCSKLEYLHLGEEFNYEIELFDLPDKNNIKTLELSSAFNKTINLELFQNLETIIINSRFHHCSIITTSTSTSTSVSTYNNYSLKNIVINSDIFQTFVKHLNSNFYQFVKIKSPLVKYQ